jgi:hypothetical protein
LDGIFRPDRKSKFRGMDSRNRLCRQTDVKKVTRQKFI